MFEYTDDGYRLDERYFMEAIYESINSWNVMYAKKHMKIKSIRDDFKYHAFMEFSITPFGRMDVFIFGENNQGEKHLIIVEIKIRNIEASDLIQVAKYYLGVKNIFKEELINGTCDIDLYLITRDYDNENNISSRAMSPLISNINFIRWRPSQTDSHPDDIDYLENWSDLHKNPPIGYSDEIKEKIKQKIIEIERERK